jgi:tetratricopeptide (TPR) repeat protein
MIDWIKSILRSPRSGTEVLLRRAEAARNEGALERARELCLSVLSRSPNDARALCLLAGMAADEKRIEEGMQWAGRAIAADPRAAASHYALGRIREAAGRYGEAESSYREATRLDATHARAHNNLGCMLHVQGRLDEALACYRKALELDPSQPEANQNYAAIARDAGAQQRAIEGYLQQTLANPSDATAFTNLANTYAEFGRQEEALASFDRAIALDPDRAEAHFGRSLVLLLCGDYAQGWKEYEWRLRISAFSAPAHRFAQPMWDGSRIDAGAILVHAEQGFGDLLQFVRYAPRVAERCAGVILECQPELKPLLQGTPGVQRLLARGEALPPFKAHVPLMSLPRIFGTTLESIPWQGPYVHADPRRVEEWRRVVGSREGARLRVALNWSGNPRFWGNRSRSIPLALLAPLARVAGVSFYSVQKGEAAAQAGAPPAGMRLVDLTAQIHDFADTAALLSQMDLFVTVDTAVAHLAGAMGIPTWVILSRVPDSRYHLERSDNPWYPTMRLFRQERDGDWPGVVERVLHALGERAGAQAPEWPAPTP